MAIDQQGLLIKPFGSGVVVGTRGRQGYFLLIWSYVLVDVYEMAINCKIVYRQYASTEKKN